MVGTSLTAQTSAARQAIADDLPDVPQPTNRPTKIMAGWVTADMLGLGRATAAFPVLAACIERDWQDASPAGMIRRP
jgi:hypothetical protein